MSPVSISRRGHVSHLVMDAVGRKNALSLEMLAELHAAVAVESAGACRALVVSGSHGTFSAGADLRDLTGTEADAAIDEAVAAARVAIREAPVPVIAAIEGPCIGAAVDLALACDIRVADASAYFQIPATRLGLLYNPAGLQQMARPAATHALRALLLTGTSIDADAAARAGLISQVAATGEAVAVADRIAQAVCENDPGAVDATKQLLNDIERGVVDTEEWAGRYRSQLSTPAREAAIRAAKTRLTPEAQESGT